MRAIVSHEAGDRLAASTSQMGRFETEWLATEANLMVLTDLSGVWIDRVHERKLPDGIALDLDSSEEPDLRPILQERVTHLLTRPVGRPPDRGSG